MPIDIAVLASTAVMSFLVPYAKNMVQAIAEQVTSKVSEKAAEHATEVTTSIWERVKAAFSSETEKATLVQFEKYPEQAAPLVEAILKDKLEKDSQLRQELEKLIDAPSPDGAGTTMQIMNAGVAGMINQPGATITGGTTAGVIFHSNSPSDPQPPPSSPSQSSNPS